MSNTSNKTELIPSLWNTIGNQSIIDLLADNGEVFLDSISESKLIDDVPVLGSIVKIGRAGCGVRDLLFTKKISYFLFQLNNTSFYERSKFMNEIITSQDLTEKIGSKILLLIEQADDFKKPELIGKLFVSFLKTEISYDIFSRLSSNINKLSIEDIVLLAESNSANLPNNLGSRVYLSGFANIDVNPLFGGSDISYSLNDFGKIMLEKCFNIVI